MAVTKISLLTETNGYDAVDVYDDPRQGTTFELVRIYKVDNDDSDPQYFKQVITLDSYGNAGGENFSASQAVSQTFVEVVPVEKTVTVFK